MTRLRATGVVVFSRAPVPGAAKRRLIPALGETGAARLHARMTAHIVHAAVAAAVGPVTVWGTPDVAHPFFAELAARHGVALRAQEGADLGARMQAALARTLRQTERAVVVGSDCPALGVEILQAAAARLEADDAVIGAAEDGGYVLLGLRRAPRLLFRGVDWGGDTVLQATRDRLSTLGWRWTELGPFPDIDRPEDLGRLPSEWLSPSAAVRADGGPHSPG